MACYTQSRFCVRPSFAAPAAGLSTISWAGHNFLQGLTGRQASASLLPPPLGAEKLRETSRLRETAKSVERCQFRHIERTHALSPVLFREAFNNGCLSKGKQSWLKADRIWLIFIDVYSDTGCRNGGRPGGFDEARAATSFELEYYSGEDQEACIGTLGVFNARNGQAPRLKSWSRVLRLDTSLVRLANEQTSKHVWLEWSRMRKQSLALQCESIAKFTQVEINLLLS